MLQKLKNSPLIRVIRLETSRIAVSWILIFYTILAPVASFLLIIWLFSDGVVKDLPVAVVDMDQSAFSLKVTRLIDATRVCKVEYRVNSMLEARNMMDRGKIDAFVVLPENLSEEKQIILDQSKFEPPATIRQSEMPGLLILTFNCCLIHTGTTPIF